MKGTGRRGRKVKQLMDNLKETRRQLHSKKEATDRTLMRTRSGREYGPLVRLWNERMKNTLRYAKIHFNIIYLIQAL
jgi:hypothetical protein